MLFWPPAPISVANEILGLNQEITKDEGMLQRLARRTVDGRVLVSDANDKVAKLLGGRLRWWGDLFGHVITTGEFGSSPRLVA